VKAAESLPFENDVVLALVQVLIGAIPSTMLAVAVSVDRESDEVDLYFAFEHVSARETDLVDEIETDFSALFGGELLVRTHTWVGDSWTNGWPGQQNRLVFAASQSERPR
jgi:hypothetical protein